jgi:signal transduction histidine kinase
VTHELKSPLAAIQLYLETLKSRKVEPAKQKEFITLMIKDVSRLQNLINSILKLSGLEEKKIATHYQVYQVDAVVKDLIEEAIDKFKLPPELIKLEGKASCQCVIDRSTLSIVVDNLIDNAIKFSPEELRLMVQMSCTDKKFILKFQDKGIGVEVKDQNKIFHKFYRIYGRNIPNIRGTGLGLHMAKEIIKTHGGDIMVFSEGENKGSTFTIELPVYQSSKKRYLRQLLKMTNKMEQQKNAA